MLSEIKKVRHELEQKKDILSEQFSKELQTEIWDLEEKLNDMRRESGVSLNPENGPLPLAMERLRDDLARMLADEKKDRDYKRNVNDAEIFVRDLLYQISAIAGGFVDDWGEYPIEWTEGVTETLEWYIYGSHSDVIVEFIPIKNGNRKRPYIVARHADRF